MSILSSTPVINEDFDVMQGGDHMEMTSTMTLKTYLANLPNRHLHDFCAPDKTVASLMESRGINRLLQAINAVRDACIKDVGYAGSEFTYAIFHAQFKEALTRNIFEQRTTLLADLVHIATLTNQGGACSGSSCTNVFDQAHGLLTSHLYKIETIGHPLAILQEYDDDEISLDEVVYRLRQLACEELVGHLAESLNEARYYLLQSEPAPINVARLCLQRHIVMFGRSALDSVPDDIHVDAKEMDTGLEKLLKCFNDAMSYSPSGEGADANVIVMKAKRDVLALDGPVQMNIMPKLQSNLEYLLAQLTTELNNKGILVKADRWLTKLRFQMAEHGVYLQQIYDLLVTTVRTLIPKYFPINDLRTAFSAQEGTGSLINMKAQGLRVGKVAMMIAGSAEAVAYSWGDLTVAIIYVLKLVRFLTQLAALWMAVKIFKDAYVQKVYALKDDPPTLQSLLKVFLGIDLTIQLILITMVVIMLAPGGAITSLVNDAFMSQLLMDEIMTTAMIALLGTIVAKYVWRKTYFHYKVDGLGAIKSYGDIMVGVCATMMVVPFFMLI